MTWPRPLFSRHHGCKKCGAASSFIGTKHVRLAFGADAIRRVCARCGFTWDERPLDADA